MRSSWHARRQRTVRWIPPTAVLTTLLLALPAAADTLPPAHERFASADAEETPSFRRHVIPLLGRLGCNGRACHGSFQGQGGFRLSLFGYDFKADHDALTGGPEPRANRADPPASLMLEKPTLATSHKGGKRFEPGSWQHHLLLRWIQAGARNDAAAPARLERLEVTPGQLVLQGLGDRVRLSVTAHWSDGTAEDVTDLTRFQSNDDAIAAVTPAGEVTAAGRGDTHVVAFYDNGITPVEVVVPVSDHTGERYPEVPTPTRVDELVAAKLRRLGIEPSPVCTDAEFLRRVSLDLTGTLPTPGEVEAFLKDPSSDKRERKVEELLARPGYAAWWATRLCDITGNNGEYPDNFFGSEYARLWYEWIYRRVRDNVPYDQIVAGIVLATSRRPGQSFEDYNREMSSYVRTKNPGDFAQRDSMPLYWSRRTALRPPERALSFSHAFLGVRLQCAQCHKHPFDQWTKQDFDGFAAFFDRIAYGTPPTDRKAYDAMAKAVNPPDPKTKIVNQGNLAKLAREGQTVPWREIYVAQPGDNGRGGPPKSAAKQGPAKDGRPPTAKPKAAAKKAPPARRGPAPKLLGGEEVPVAAGTDPRAPLMAWLRRPDNRYFARAFVNRVWATYFNVGIVEPPDDLSAANPPSNGPLLDYLAQGFIEHEYDMKWLHREIILSHTYQRSCRPTQTNAHDTRNFSHAVPRRIPAEVAYDAVNQATAADRILPRWQADLAKRAIGVNGLRGRRPSSVLAVFGRPDRISNCDCERSNEPSLLQTLFLLNDNEILNLVARGDGWVADVARPFLPQPPPKQPRPDPSQKDRSGKAPGGANAAQARKANARPTRPRIPSAEEVARFIRIAYLRTVSRPPTGEELARARRYLKESPRLDAGLRDLLWALLNTDEFIVNH